MKRCEDKLRYRTAVGARWALWNIWWDRYVGGRRRRLRGGRQSTGEHEQGNEDGGTAGTSGHRGLLGGPTHEPVGERVGGV